MPKLALTELRGMNANGAALQLPHGDASFMQNMWARPFKNWHKRNSLYPHSSQTGPVMGIFEFDLDNLVIPIIGVGPDIILWPQVHVDPVIDPLVDPILDPNPFEPGDGRTTVPGLDPGGVTTLKKKGRGGNSGCTYTGDFSAINHDYTGFTYSIAVGAQAGCSWNVTTSNASMIQLGLGTVHLSGGTVSFTVTENHDAASRSGNIYFRKFTSGGDLIATVVVTQTAAPEPVPLICPGHPPLLDTYAISGNVTDAFRLIGGTFAFPFDTSVFGVLDKSAGCAWGKILNLPNRSATLALSTTVGGVKCWKLAVSYQTLPCPWTAWYYKPTGSTPVGDYTPEPVGINGAPFSGTTGTITIL